MTVYAEAWVFVGDGFAARSVVPPCEYDHGRGLTIVMVVLAMTKTMLTCRRVITTLGLASLSPPRSLTNMTYVKVGCLLTWPDTGATPFIARLRCWASGGSASVLLYEESETERAGDPTA